MCFRSTTVYYYLCMYDYLGNWLKGSEVFLENILHFDNYVIFFQ